jgi:hypothetical protein
MQDCNDCYFPDRTKDIDLEPGEKCFCTLFKAFRKHPCKNWVCETSVELGEETLADSAIEGDIWVSGDPLTDLNIDRELDKLLRRDDA